jgi:hypothetical protein
MQICLRKQSNAFLFLFLSLFYNQVISILNNGLYGCTIAQFLQIIVPIHNPIVEGDQERDIILLLTISVCCHCSLLHQKLIVLSGCNSSCCAPTCIIVGLPIHQSEPHLRSLYVCGCLHTYDHLLCTK